MHNNSDFISVIMFRFLNVKVIITDNNYYYLHEFPWNVQVVMVHWIQLKKIDRIKMFNCKSKLETFDAKRVKQIVTILC